MSLSLYKKGDISFRRHNYVSLQMQITTYPDMLFYTIILCLVSAISGLPLHNHYVLDGRIIGGSDTNITKHPHQVSIQFLSKHWCGGSIVSANYILTAAHCLASHLSMYKVRVGSSESNRGSIHAIARIIAHPLFDPFSMDYDIAFLQLSSPIKFSTSAQAVPLAAKCEEVLAGTTSVATGWGRLQDNGTDFGVLQEVELPIVSNEECRKMYGSFFTDRMICAGFHSGGKDTCMGDSGGPLVANGKQVGIVSWGRGCALSGFPGVYARVAALRDWIAENSGV